MSRRGPAPTPTALLALRGSKLARRRTSEPRPAVQAPTCPKLLTGEARKEWRRLVPLLITVGVLTKADRATLAGYCRSWQRWLKAEAEVDRTAGEVVKSPSGYPIHNPWLSIANQALQQIMRLGAELGLSPAARTRIKAETPPAHHEDGLDQLLRDGTGG